LIPNEIIEEIRYRNDIVDVISGYVALKRSGSGLVGLCPFHSEKTPSFHVKPERGIFHCFGCGAGGDVITFIRKIENLDYLNAAEFLAKRAGIQIPASSRDDAVRGGVKKARILEINREAAKFFHASLLKSPEALAYIDKRGLTKPVVKHFGVGYAPDAFGAVTDHMTSLGFTAEELTAAFLCGISSKTGKPFDYFRGRIMFPIIDVTGEVIAFGGRIIGDGQPKYLNTSDTPAFKKSRSLFALNFAKSDCAERMILCEGYMDVIALHAAGFTNAVATLGTALTPEQARIMKRYTKSVIICYDSDTAGQTAADRAFPLLSGAGLDAKVLTVTGAKDPDEFIKKYGGDAFRRLLDGSRSRFEFKLDAITEKYKIAADGTAPYDDKLKAGNEAIELLATIYSDTERELCVKRAAERLGVTAESMGRDVSKRRKKLFGEEKKARSRETLRATEGYGDRLNPDKLRFRCEAAAEEVILGVLLLFPELISEALKIIGPDDFKTSLNRKIFSAMSAVEGSGNITLSLLGQSLTEDEMSRAVSYMTARSELTKNDLEVISGCAATLRSSACASGETPASDDIAAFVANRRLGGRGT
jgi:DNA primase, catalytic core